LVKYDKFIVQEKFQLQIRSNLKLRDL